MNTENPIREANILNPSSKPIPMQTGQSGQYGAEVMPNGPLQDMFASVDTIAGGVHTRDDAPSAFTGGTTGAGLGGVVVTTPSPTADSLGGPQQDVP